MFTILCFVKKEGGRDGVKEIIIDTFIDSPLKLHFSRPSITHSSIVRIYWCVFFQQEAFP